MSDQLNGLNGSNGGWTSSRKTIAMLLMACTLGIGILIGTVVNGHGGQTRAFFDGGAKTLAVPDPVNLSSTFTNIVPKVSPAVVYIYTVGPVHQRTVVPRWPPSPNHPNNPSNPNNQNNPGNPNSPEVRPHGNPNGGGGDDQDLQNFLNRFFDNPDQEDEEPDRSLGSGIIVDPKGYILTNNHVVEDASSIKVRFYNDADNDANSTDYPAKVVGTDTHTDLAVIKIEPQHDLPVAKLGNSDGVRVGDWVLAIGSPFELTRTVTAGIISAKDRRPDPDSTTQFQRFFQTDAAINPGNSGGPLVDMAGQVIGINTAIMTGSRSMANEGIGFALPSNTAIRVYNQIITHGHVVRGSIGISFSEPDSANPIVLKQLGAQYGMIVGSVTPGGPADKAGLKVGDVIVSANGKPIHRGDELVDTITETNVGDKVNIGFIRDKQQHQVAIVVVDYEKEWPDQAQQDQTPSSSEAVSEFGLHVEDLTPDTAHRLGVDVKQGVVVGQPDPASFAEDLRFQAGDVITEINGQPITNVADFKKAIAALKPGQDVIFKVVERAVTAGSGEITRLLAGVVPAAPSK
jgi:serine protease Do